MKILLVDDDQELGDMLQEYLSGEGIEATIVYNGQDALTQVNKDNYKAVILDIMLPDISGIEVLRQIRKNSRIPIIMLTAKGDNIDRVIGLEMGADDYMPKPCYPRELIARLKAVLRRFEEKTEAPPENVDIEVSGLSLSPTRRVVEYQGKELELTASEFNLLEILLKNPERVVSKDELSEKGIGRKRQIYDRSVDVHISNVRQKLHAATLDKITIETVRSVGYTIRVF